MQKLRELYKETQSNAKKDFDRVTQQRMKKILVYCNKQFTDILNKNDYTDLDEVTFYRQKFEEIVQIYDRAVKQGLKKALIQQQIQEVLREDYAPQGQIIKQVERSRTLPPKQQLPPSQKDSKSGKPQKSLIQTYLDNKKQQIQSSKIGFKSVLQGISYAPKKFPVKHPQRNHFGHLSPSDRNEEITSLQRQIQILKRQFASKQNEKQMNMQFIHHEKKAYEDKIAKLKQHLYDLQLQNTRLKQESVKNYPIYDYQPLIVSKPVMPLKEKQEFKPYFTKYRDNDINKIKSKNGIDINDNFRSNSPLSYTQLHPSNHNAKEQSDKDISSNIDISSQNRSERSNMIDEAKSVAIKSKISFFKSSMIIYKSKDFEIAVKSTDIIQLELKKISIYVNNKTNLRKTVNLEYKYDRHYYEIKHRNKMKEVEGHNQARQQVEVRFMSESDLDSLIEVHITVDTKQLSFLLPAMFIEFLQKRPTLDRSVSYASKKVNPIHQFADLVSASEILPLEKQYGQIYETGRVYAISKHHEGYITFRWTGGQVQVETIAPWRLFICYLLLKQY